MCIIECYEITNFIALCNFLVILIYTDAYNLHGDHFSDCKNSLTFTAFMSFSHCCHYSRPLTVDCWN